RCNIQTLHPFPLYLNFHLTQHLHSPQHISSQKSKLDQLLQALQNPNNHLTPNDTQLHTPSNKLIQNLNTNPK
ncbi:hypothetical protein, partial [Staphylococcus epidermidis]|uniref:hypothetical protein n=1 Tax=Staphylococcus epidermidis TaxID=1282 RepID=UPI001C92FE81